MIKVMTKNKNEYRAHKVVNKGGWFGVYWLVCFDTNLNILVGAEDAASAIDEIVDDHRFYHLLWDSRNEEDEYTYYAGNYGEPVELDNVMIYYCTKVDWFAEPE